MQLESYIKKIDASRELVVSQRSIYTAKDLIGLATFLRSKIDFRDRHKLVIACESTVYSLAWMIALDGFADTVFLVPASLRLEGEFRSLVEQSGCDEVIDDDFRVGENVFENRGADIERGSATRWLLATSGTTGTPKLVGHSTKSLTSTTKVDVAMGAAYRWALVYEPFRFAGLQVVLQSLTSGSLLLVCNEDSIAKQVELIKENKVNAMSATPSYWRKLLMHGGLKSHVFRQITLGGETADQSILTALSNAFPQSRIAHIYASTETGVGFSVTDLRAGFPQDYILNGIGGNELRISSHGTLEIKPHRATQFLADDGFVPVSEFVDTGDLVELKQDRVFFVGRKSGTINVGGNKVAPEEIESIIRAVPGVAEVVVVGKNSGLMGQIVEARVVVKDQEANLKKLKFEIRTACRNSLQKHKVPGLVRFVPKIDANAAGKISRR